MKNLIISILAIHCIAMAKPCQSTNIDNVDTYQENNITTDSNVKTKKTSKMRTARILRKIAVPCIIAYSVINIPSVDGGPITGLACSNACALSCGGSGPFYLGCFAACNTLCIPLYTSPSP